MGRRHGWRLTRSTTQWSLAMVDVDGLGVIGRRDGAKRTISKKLSRMTVRPIWMKWDCSARRTTTTCTHPAGACSAILTTSTFENPTAPSWTHRAEGRHSPSQINSNLLRHDFRDKSSDDDQRCHQYNTSKQGTDLGLVHRDHALSPLGEPPGAVRQSPNGNQRAGSTSILRREPFGRGVAASAAPS